MLVNGLAPHKWAITRRCVNDCEPGIHTVASLQLQAPGELWIVEAGRYVAMKINPRSLMLVSQLARAKPISQCPSGLGGLAARTVSPSFYLELLRMYALPQADLRKLVRRFLICKGCSRLTFVEQPTETLKAGQYDIPREVAKPVTGFLRDQGRMCNCRPR